MAVQFPLEMKNGVMVRNINDLRKNFDINKVVDFYLNGQLLIWLEAREFEEEMSLVSMLDRTDPELAKKLCEIFAVDYVPTNVFDTNSAIERNDRILQLKQFTEDESIIEYIHFVAFNQHEMMELVCNGTKSVYLCGDSFSIPAQSGVRYIGINEPEVTFDTENAIKMYIANKIDVTNVIISPECKKAISQLKFRVEAKVTKFYNKELGRKSEKIKQEQDIFSEYNTIDYVNAAQRACSLHYKPNNTAYNLYNHKYKDENGTYDRILCLYKIYDDKEELLLGNKVGIKRYAVTERYVFFTGCYFSYDVLYAYDKYTEEVKKIKKLNEIRIIDAYDDRCIFYYEYGAPYYPVKSIDLTGEVKDMGISVSTYYYSWTKDGGSMYEGFVYNDTFYYGQKQIMAYDLKTGISRKLYEKGDTSKGIVVEKNLIFFCQDSKVFEYNMDTHILKYD